MPGRPVNSTASLYFAFFRNFTLVDIGIHLLPDFPFPPFPAFMGLPTKPQSLQIICRPEAPGTPSVPDTPPIKAQFMDWHCPQTSRAPATEPFRRFALAATISPPPSRIRPCPRLKPPSRLSPRQLPRAACPRTCNPRKSP